MLYYKKERQAKGKNIVIRIKTSFLTNPDQS